MLRELGSGKVAERAPVFARPFPWLFSACLTIAVSIAYFLTARLSLALLRQPDGVAAFWPAAGVAAGVVISVGTVARVPVVVGAMVATIVANVLGDRNIWSALVFGACNAGEAVLVAGLIERSFTLPFSLDSLHRVLGLVMVAFIGSTVSGIGGSVGYLLFHSSTASDLTIWCHWLTSDGIGIITVAPLFVGLPSLATDPLSKREFLEGTLALTILAALSGLVIQLPNDTWTGEIAIATLFPMLLWIAARCRPAFAAAASLVWALTIIWTTTFGIGIFGNLPISDRILPAQASVLAVSLCALVLAALFAERRQHAAALAENEARLQSALRAGGVTAFDWLVGVDVSQHSDNAAEVLGLSPQQTRTGTSFLERVHPEDRQRLKACLRGAIPDNPSYDVTFRYLLPNDHEVWLEETGQVEFDPVGRIVRVKGLTRDITDRKRVEVELATARKAAELANRSKTAFLSAASHDLRQPLQNLNLLQNALERLVQDGKARALITRIGQSLGVMKGILDSLLDVNRLEGGVLVGSMSDFQINDVFDSVATDFIELATAKGLKLRVVRSRVAVRSDRRLVEVMVRNLLSNAIRYTERGKILLGCRRAGDKVRIEVWDSGIGIKAEHVPHIFNEYYQNDESAHPDGYGLGLAIVERLGKLLDHHISVRSVFGNGSGFSIDLPLGKVKAEAVDRLTMTNTGGSAPFRGTILLIEDDPFVREGLESLLTSEGLDVVVAANANEALARVARKNTYPDFILSDFNLRGSMDGVECIKALRAIRASKIPAIVLTGDTRSEQLETIAKHDVGVATKPVDGDELLQLINHICAHS